MQMHSGMLSKKEVHESDGKFFSQYDGEIFFCFMFVLYLIG